MGRPLPRYRLDQLAIPLAEAGTAGRDGDNPALLASRLARNLGCRPEDIRDLSLERKSVDARDRGDIRLVYRVSFALESNLRRPPRELKGAETAPKWRIPALHKAFKGNPVVVGAGPAGLFAALALAEAGAKPLLLERGDPVEVRKKKVSAFFAGGALDPESNIQFGEGGAGTWSDGKLTTQVKDLDGRRGKVLDELIAAGAPAETAWLAKPHLGTDRLEEIVRNLRLRIEALGGNVRFRARVDDLVIKGGRLAGLRLADGSTVETDAAILAPGHSARELFALLRQRGVSLEAKPFAMGLRVEHSQELISRNQYGNHWQHPALGPAEYRLAAKTSDDRGVYSFCMCPGDTVVNASSELEGLVCNGMSRWLRDGRNANAAIVVAVHPGDFTSGDPLAGIAFQREWERRAWTAAAGALPVQLFGDFRVNRPSRTLGDIRPDSTGPWAFASLAPCLPESVYRGILQGMAAFDRQIRGFAADDVVLTGVETRTSSPIRIHRDQGCESSLKGLFVAGEGPGYAGGIMSAAMDGLLAASRLLESPHN